MSRRSSRIRKPTERYGFGPTGISKPRREKPRELEVPVGLRENVTPIRSRQKRPRTLRLPPPETVIPRELVDESMLEENEPTETNQQLVVERDRKNILINIKTVLYRL
jgi:hypothetical protein